MVVELPPPPPPPTPIHVQFLCYDPATDEAVFTVEAAVSKEAAGRFLRKLWEYSQGPLKSHGDMELAVRYRGELCDYYLGKGPLPAASPMRACPA